MTKAHNIISFVLRFTQDSWQDTQGEPHIRWRGYINHVQSDDEVRFTDVSQALAFIQGYLTRLTVDTFSRSQVMNQEKFFWEGFKLWERLALNYISIMFQAMEHGLKQSERLTAQIEGISQQFFKPWRLPEQPNQKQLLEVLAELQEQIQALTERIEALEEELHQETKEA